MCKCFVRIPVVQDVVGVPDYAGTPFNFPIDGAYLPFFFTNESFTRVLSSLVNGAKLSYGDQAYQVIWDFLVNVEYPVSLCDQIAQCIDTNPITQQSIRNFVTNDTTINNHIQNISRTGNPMTQPEIEALIGDGCDENQLFGGIVALVDQMNTNNIDFMQLFEVATNLVERASALVAALPVFETLPFDDLIAFVDRVFNEIYENYEAQVTTDLLNQYKCDLFCLAQEREGCGFTYEDLYEYYRNRVSGTFTIESLFQQVVEFLATGSWTGTLVVDFMYMLQIQVMRSASDFLGVNVLALQTYFAIGELTPDSSWTLVCDECPSFWCRSFTAASGLDTVFVPAGGLGAAALWTGTGWSRNDSVAVGRITLQGDMGSSVNITSVQIIRTTSFNGGDTNTTTLYTSSFGVVQAEGAIPTNLTLYASFNAQIFQIDEVSSTNSSIDPITGEIIEIVVRGTGTPPDVGSEC